MENLITGFEMFRNGLLAIAGVVLCVYGVKIRSLATFLLGTASFLMVAVRIAGQDEFGWAAGVAFVGACVLKILEKRGKRAEKQKADDPFSPRIRH